jgi:hypothetical protein
MDLAALGLFGPVLGFGWAEVGIMLGASLALPKDAAPAVALVRRHGDHVFPCSPWRKSSTYVS